MRDPATSEAFIELVTQEVLSFLAKGGAAKGGAQPHDGCEDCGCQGRGELCAQKCQPHIRELVTAGAERFSAGLGATRVAPDLARTIDHTLLKPEASEAEVTRLCLEARQYGFASVCINPSWVRLAARLLRGSEVKVCTVVGFPLGATSTGAKVAETRQAIADGAHEIDMVISVGALKSGRDDAVREDIAAVVQTAHRHGAIVKVIIEAALLSDEEKVRACQAARDAGADFVKTSTGFGPGGATLYDVALMRRVVGATMGVKAAGGVKTREDALAMIEAGATRIGASAGVKIVGGAGTPLPAGRY